jgi:hypothetical protein
VKWLEGCCFVFDFEFEHVLSWAKTFFVSSMYVLLIINSFLADVGACKAIIFLEYALL